MQEKVRPQQAASKTEERIFSSLSYVNDRFERNAGSLFGATALIAGTTIGAGILAVPAVTRDAGFLGGSAALIGQHLKPCDSSLPCLFTTLLSC